ncbi:ATP-binding protein [Uliginosibacterium sp. H3]|uniref:histidine kinase n=1 Tax=Uliginosibacterium silvisoli TaxID=3114758 RepID=A0ABU6JYA7_9RHOO|nr:ATP-binding protein [Uliginosibacterium sp. H3]
METRTDMTTPTPPAPRIQRGAHAPAPGLSLSSQRIVARLQEQKSGQQRDAASATRPAGVKKVAASSTGTTLITPVPLVGPRNTTAPQTGTVLVAEATLVEQARLIHRNIPTATFFGFLVACLFALVFSRVTPILPLGIWLGCAAVLTTYRLLSWRQYQKQTFDAALARHWLRQALIGAGLSGSLWGLASFFLLPAGQFTYEMLFVYAVVMMAVASMFSYHASYPTFLAFVLPSLGLSIIGLFVRNADLEWAVATGIGLFLVIALRFVWTFNEMFLRSLQLRFENKDLVASLTVEKETAETANQAKSRFLAAASHDLRQPMHALNLYLGSLDGLDLSNTARAMVRNVRMCAGTMDEMFRALLDVSRLDAQAVTPELVSFPVASILDRIRGEFGPQAMAKGLKLRVVPCSAFVHSDIALSERVLRNFVHNAVRYTESGTILVGCRRHGDRLQLCVHDTGIGIAGHEQRRIFEEFYQTGNRERDRSKGLGLGLAIVKRLATLLEAPVTVRSQPGRGSVFAFELPRVEAEPTHVPDAGFSTMIRQAGDVAGSLVVVVDDEELVRTATQALLHQWGCIVVVAASRDEALAKLAASPRAPDAILCDYRLGAGDNGAMVIEALRNEFNSDIPALLLTGDTGPDSLRKIAATGLPVLHKPIDVIGLRRELVDLLRVRAADQP